MQRVFVGPKASRLNVKCSLGDRPAYIDLIAFRALKDVKAGDHVTVTGHLSSEKSGIKEVNPKTGREYDKWIPLLVIDRIDSESAQQPLPNTKSQYTPPVDDDIPF